MLIAGIVIALLPTLLFLDIVIRRKEEYLLINLITWIQVASGLYPFSLALILLSKNIGDSSTITSLLLFAYIIFPILTIILYTYNSILVKKEREKTYDERKLRKLEIHVKRDPRFVCGVLLLLLIYTRFFG